MLYAKVGLTCQKPYDFVDRDGRYYRKSAQPTTLLSILLEIKEFPNAVIHVINGIFTEQDYDVLKGHGLKILILGYKDLRRGSEYLAKARSEIYDNQKWLENHINDMVNKFDVVSFDNLAIEQLHIKKQWGDFSDGEWDEFYAGDDGNFTYYIDMVERKFARSSTAPFDKRYDLLDNVDDMFKIIQNEK